MADTWAVKSNRGGDPRGESSRYGGSRTSRADKSSSVSGQGEQYQGNGDGGGQNYAKKQREAKARADASAKRIREEAKSKAEKKLEAEQIEQAQVILAKAVEKTEGTDARRLALKQKEQGLLSQENIVTPSGQVTVDEVAPETEAKTESSSRSLINSFLPDVVVESLKGKGNYSPDWVAKNKAAGAEHLESLYASGQLTRPRSNFTDGSGNAIGGVANSQDNVAMQNMAANGVADPLSTLSREVSDNTGLDTSWTGAWRQAVDGAGGHNYEGGSGLLKYAEASGSGINQGDFEKSLTETTNAKAATTGQTAEQKVNSSQVNGVPVDDISTNAIDINKFSDNLGFGSKMEAQGYWNSMTPEAQGIFNSKENPQAQDRILTGIFGAMVPGFGLLNKYLWSDKMTLKEKLEQSNKTALSVAKSRDNMEQNLDQGSGGNSGSSDANKPPPAVTGVVDDGTYSNVDSYLKIFNNYKF